MNTDTLIGLATVATIYLAFFAADLANARIRIDGGKKAAIAAAITFFGGLALIVLGAHFESMALCATGIFLTSFEYCWAYFRQLDIVCGDGLYPKEK